MFKTSHQISSFSLKKNSNVTCYKTKFMYSVLVFMIALSAVWYFLSALGCFSFTTTIVVGLFAFVWNDCFFYFPLFRKPFLEVLSWTCSWNLKSWSLLDSISCHVLLHLHCLILLLWCQDCQEIRHEELRHEDIWLLIKNGLASLQTL